VAKIHVKRGAAVERGAILVTLADTLAEPEG
jgi:biotin carboxyl carrier protein